MSLCSLLYRRLGFTVVVTMLVVGLLPQAAKAADVVSNCSTYGPGTGTLQTALVGGGTITFACSGTIYVPTISVTVDTTLDASAQNVTLSGSSTHPIFDMNVSTVTLSLNHLTLANGRSASSGGAIYSRGTLIITDSIFRDNLATGLGSQDGGGAIYNEDGAEVTISNTTFLGNRTAGNFVSGGAIYNGGFGVLNVTDSTFSNNSARGDQVAGGAIFSDTLSMVTISGSTFLANSVTNGDNAPYVTGGAIHGEGNMNITGSTFADNTGSSGLFFVDRMARGGAIFNGMHTLSIADTIFSDNSVIHGVGGAIYNIGTLDLSNATFDGNSATNYNGGSVGEGGGIYNSSTLTITDSVFSNNIGWEGAAIYSNEYSNTFSVVGTFFSTNKAGYMGGAVLNQGNMTLMDSEFRRNSALMGGAVTTAVGTAGVNRVLFAGNSSYVCGGMDNVDGTVNIVASTFSGNSGLKGSGFCNTGALATATIDSATFSSNISVGGALYNEHILTITNSIVANSINGTNCTGNPLTDDGFNLATDPSCGAGFAVTTPTLLKLASLADNGGQTATHALLPGSSALDKGDCNSGVDQRGVPRPWRFPEYANAEDGNGCDIGAYEAQSWHYAAPVRHYFVTTTPTLTWDRLLWAASYEVEVANNPMFSGASQYTTDEGELSVVADTPPLADGLYYWRVRGIGADGPGSWSAAETFAVDVP